MKILAVIISYYPEKDLLLRNINAIINSVDNILIWENTPKLENEKYRFISHPKIRYYGTGENIGISKALNIVWLEAKKDKFHAILTMDQDSCLLNATTYIKSCFDYNGLQNSVFCPSVTTDVNQSKCINNIIKLDRSQYPITSGCLVPIRVLEKVNGYREDFLVDAVDIDFAIRLHLDEIDIYRNENGLLLQHFGHPTIHELFGKEYILSNYSPFRLKGIFRNHIILYRQYHYSWIKEQVLIYIKHFLPRILFWETHKLRKLYAITVGIWQGFRFKF